MVPEPEPSQRHRYSVLANATSADIGDAIIPAMGAKEVRVIVVPAHGHLDHPLRFGIRRATGMRSCAAADARVCTNKATELEVHGKDARAEL